MIALHHDFGLLRPNSQATHRFEVSNDSDVAWTVNGKNIDSTCACAVAKASAPTVQPGETEWFDVKYKSGPNSADDRRTISIRFPEPEGPILRLSVSASIRPAVQASTDQLAFAGNGRDFEAEQFFELVNYSGADWKQVDVDTTAPWLSARATFWRYATYLDEERQVWRVVVNADARRLRAGRHAADLTIQCRGAETDELLTNETRVHVTLALMGAVDVIPERMFFSNRSSDGNYTCTVLLRCNSRGSDEVAKAMTIRHDMDEWLHLSVSKRSPTLLDLKGTLALPHAVQTAKGTILLDLHDDEGTVIELPVSALR